MLYILICAAVITPSLVLFVRVFSINLLLRNVSFFFCSHLVYTFQLLDKPWSQVTTYFPPRFLPSTFIAHKVQQSHCSSIFHRVWLTHALAHSTSQFVHKKKSQRTYTSMHSAWFELRKLTYMVYTRIEDNMIRHRGDRIFLETLSRYVENKQKKR